MHKTRFFFFDISAVEFYKNLQSGFNEFKKQFQQLPTAANILLFGSIILSFSKFPVYNIIQTMQRVYERGDITLFRGNCIEILNKAAPESVDMIFADPPYMLSNGGITCQSGKVVSVNKGKWDKSKGIDEDFEFHTKWINACRRVLKPNGTIWISGTCHSIYERSL